MYSRELFKCDAIMQDESEVENFFSFIFWHFLLGYYLRFNLVKTPWRLGNWFPRNSTLSDWKNNKKERIDLLYMAISLNYICEFRLILLDCITNINCIWWLGEQEKTAQVFLIRLHEKKDKKKNHCEVIITIWITLKWSRHALKNIKFADIKSNNAEYIYVLCIELQQGWIHSLAGYVEESTWLHPTTPPLFKFVHSSSFLSGSYDIFHS